MSQEPMWLEEKNGEQVDCSLSAPNLISCRRTIVPQIETTVEEHPYVQVAQSPSPPSRNETDRRATECKPLAQWDSLSPMMIPRDVHNTPSVWRSVKAASAGNNTVVRTRFQRFIQRLENAGPQLVLDRLRESLQEPADLEEELLEQQLWLLTGFQLQLPGKARVVPKPQCDTGNILELYGNLCK